MQIMWWLIASAAIAAPAPIPVGVHPQWTDYEYDTDSDWYGERTTTVEAVEILHRFPGGVRGWQYAGVIRTEEIANYETGETTTVIWWGSQDGRNGTEGCQNDAVGAILNGRAFVLVP